MEGDSSAPTNGGPISGSVPAASSPPQTSEEPKSSPIPSMSGALQGEDAKHVDDAPTRTVDAEGM
jgi:hypothetical protein